MTKKIRIHLVRHGKPDLSRNVWLSRTEYMAWWAHYNQVGLDPEDVPRRKTLMKARHCTCFVSSNLRRAVETAEVLAEGRPVEASDLYREAPLPPLWILGWLRAKPIAWGTLSRITWWMGLSGGKESHWTAKSRAWSAVEELTKRANEHGDVMLCGHGWFNRMIAKRLRQSGWKKETKGGDAYWGCRTMVKEVVGTGPDLVKDGAQD